DQFISESESGARLNHINGKPMSSGTLTVYRTVRNGVEEFRKEKGYDLKFDNLQLQFYDDFVQYLKFTKNFSTNTLGKYIKTVKTVMREANEKGLTDNIQYRSKRFKVLTEATDKIYLNEAELQKMIDLDLSDNFRLERVRDLFILGCWTGLRYIDFIDISPKSIRGDFLKVKQIKTDSEVVIPIHDHVRNILNRYQNLTNNSLPPAISNAKMNLYVKEVAELAGLDEIVETKVTKAGKTVSKIATKHQIVATHTARRSFATNMYQMGVPTITIMAITGHKTETSFMRYIKVTPEEHAKRMMEIWKTKIEKEIKHNE
ncbi:MAG: tyrosine-type recombinase/integrase, partial [Ignavibacteria bacterium]|nr:tyrosine-type recombinase/integrase [Ignavibacteria bacterium]